MAVKHSMIWRKARKVSPGSPDKRVADVELQFIRQLYDSCLARHGADHEQTRLVSDHISALERRASSRAGAGAR
jgi:hypothetical protein